jgi:hypothetical protein
MRKIFQVLNDFANPDQPLFGFLHQDGDVFFQVIQFDTFLFVNDFLE